MRRARWRYEVLEEEKEEDAKKGKEEKCRAPKSFEIARKNRLFRRAGIYVHLHDTLFTSIKFYGIYATRYRIREHVSIETGWET